MRKNIICIIINTIIFMFIDDFFGTTPFLLFLLGMAIGGCEAIFLNLKERIGEANENNRYKR